MHQVSWYIDLERYELQSSKIYFFSHQFSAELYRTLNHALHIIFYLITCSFRNKLNRNHPYWYFCTILILKNKKIKAYKRFLVSGLNTYYIIYSNYRRQPCAEIKTIYKNYTFTTQRNLKSEPTKFCFFFENVKKKTVGFPSSMTFYGAIFTNPTDICNQFANFFENVYVSKNIVYIYIYIFRK